MATPHTLHRPIRALLGVPKTAVVLHSGLIQPRHRTITNNHTVALIEVVDLALHGEEVHLLNTTNLAAADLVQVHSQLGVVRTVLLVHYFLCASSHSLSQTSLVPYRHITENLQKR